MKQLFTLFLLIATVTLNAQSHRFADTTAEWNVLQTEYFWGAPLTRQTTQTLTVTGDTTIGSYEYQKIYGGPIGEGFWFGEGTTYVRRDSSNKIYRLRPNEDEVLIYDFGAEAGDSIYVMLPFGIDSTLYIVDSTNSVNWNGIKKRMYLNGGYTIWVDGVGTIIEHTLYPNVSMAIIDGPVYTFLCYHEQGQLLYQAQDTCLIFSPTGIQDLESGEKVGLYPNPANSIIYLTSEHSLEGKHYSIIDLTGRMIDSGSLTTHQTINVANIAAGNYQVIIQDGDKKVLKRLTVQHH